MTLFVLFVILGFILKTASTLPGSRLPEYPAWISWTVAAVLWAIGGA